MCIITGKKVNFGMGMVNIVNQFMDCESGAGYVSGSGSDAATQGLVASSGDFYGKKNAKIDFRRTFSPVGIYGI